MNPELFRNIIFSISGLSFGMAAVAIWAHTYELFRYRDYAHAIGHILVKVAWIMVVGTVFISIIIPTTQIPPTTEGWVYVAGLVAGSAGFLLQAFALRQHSIRGR